ncbi:hypothetical protein BDP27DRAFT_849611 [Rhodocollybia butyracea]|uniref:Uncharacterized protein n=1 Tax=Rhodocollybia butyracea TaxID=206335 RepID=A0A9P5PQC6_9AGAR|nr:hypothetical protein BDP27DRAFT_849611 [Rhodocollybia butyracea]
MSPLRLTPRHKGDAEFLIAISLYLPVSVIFQKCCKILIKVPNKATIARRSPVILLLVSPIVLWVNVTLVRIFFKNLNVAIIQAKCEMIDFCVTK